MVVDLKKGLGLKNIVDLKKVVDLKKGVDSKNVVDLQKIEDYENCRFERGL